MGWNLSIRQRSKGEMQLAGYALSIAEAVGLDVELMHGRYEFSDHIS